MKRLREQADFDQAETNPSKLHSFDKQEFSDRGRADLKVRPNDPRFADNPMADKQLNEFAGDGHIDRLHEILSKLGITDQEIAGNFKLKQSGMTKIAGRLGISPDDVQTYLYMLQQQLRDDTGKEEDDRIDLFGSMGLSIQEQYYNAINVIDEDDEEAGQPNRPFAQTATRSSRMR